MNDESARIRTALGDRYVLEREVGAGGVAVVYLARDLRHDRPVAVKVLRSDLVGSIASARFLREIQITASLTHPNVVPLFDSGEKDGFVYFVMPYVEARSLAHRLREEGQIPVAEATRIAGEVAEALAHAHRHGVIHRDIKPSNILLAEGHAMVADFGIARAVRDAAVGDLTSSGVAIGTPAYMSPEQASGHAETDERSDIYSLGCVLYEMLAGEPPFHAATPVAMVARHLNQAPPPVRIVRPSVSDELEAVVDTALAKLPADRFPTAEMFLHALQATETGSRHVPTDPASYMPDHITAPAPHTPATRRVRRYVTAVAVAAVAAGGVFAVRALMPDAASRLSDKKVVVFPLADVDGDGTAGADVALVLGMALEQTDPLKWIDGWNLLEPDVRLDPERMPPGRGRTLALQRGAGFYLDGAVLHRGDSLSVTLVLHDTQTDSVVSRSSRSGLASATSPDRLGLQAVVQILPALAGSTGNADIAYLLHRDPAAVALWIQGEREYRQAHFVPAVALFGRAVAADSLMVLAALKGAEAAAWAHQPEGRGVELARAALEHEAYLPPRHRALAKAYLAYVEGRADEAESHLRAALAEDPDWSEAWMLLGETYHHLIPSDIVIGVSAPQAFAQAEKADPTFLPPLIHLAEYAIQEGKLQDARGYFRRLQEGHGDPSSLAELATMLDCVEHGPGSVDWQKRLAADTQAVLVAGVALAMGGAHLSCAEAAFRTVREHNVPRKWGAFLGLQGVLVAEGRFDESGAALQALSDSGLAVATGMVQVLDVFAGAPTESGAQGFVELVRQATHGTFSSPSVKNPLAPWLAGLWLAHAGNLVDLKKAENGLRTIVSGKTPLYMASLAGYEALARGDTATAMAVFASLPTTDPRNDLTWNLGAGWPVERLTLACLYLARGQARDAMRTATLLEHPQPVGFLPFLAQSLRVRLEAARMLHDTGGEEEIQARLRTLGRSDLIARPPCTSIQGDTG